MQQTFVSGKYTSVGKPLTDVEVEIRDENHRLCNTGMIGFIYVKSPSLMKGYIVHGVLQDINIVDGWLKTSDIGFVDKEGHIFIVGRGDDIIIRNGYNINPEDIEEIISNVVEIEDCIVFGVPDPLINNKIVCCYKKKISVPDPKDIIIEKCKSELASFQTPNYFIEWTSIPYNGIGKKMRKLASEIYSQIYQAKQ
jgi:long-chain acyl-CoA synthetase